MLVSFKHKGCLVLLFFLSFVVFAQDSTNNKYRLISSFTGLSNYTILDEFISPNVYKGTNFHHTLLVEKFKNHKFQFLELSYTHGKIFHAKNTKKNWCFKKF